MTEQHCKLLDDLINKPDIGNIIKNIDFIPELNEAKHIKQKGGISVYEHTIEVVECLENRNIFTVMSALFHDLGKIHTRTFCKQSNSIRFEGHQYQSALIAKNRLFDINLRQSYIDIICRIIRTHMYDIMNTTSQTSILKFIADVGRENISDWFSLRRADILSYTPKEHRQKHSKDKIIIHFEERLNSVLELNENFDSCGFFKECAYE